MSCMPVDKDSSDEDSDLAVGSDNAVRIRRPMNWPNILDAMRACDPTFHINSLPPQIKKRLSALKKLQFDMTNVEAEFFNEVHELECKYNDRYLPYFSKRESIINGSYEPKEEECNFPLSDEPEEEISKETDNIPKIDETQYENLKGIPEFWYTILKNIGMTNDMIQPYDEPILKHLEDVKVILKPPENMGFKLIFNFSTNEYFSNTVLTKEYDMKCKRDDTDPFGFEGPEIYKSKGCNIDWYKGKNVTIKVVKKKQKHKDHGSFRTVPKIVSAESFFNFFNPPSIPDDRDAEIEDEVQAVLTADFEIGHYLRERVIPRAVLYFTGEALDDEEDDEDLDDEVSDENKNEEDEEEEEETGEEEGGADFECKGDN